RERIKPLFRASIAFGGTPSTLHYLIAAEISKGPEAFTAGLKQLQQKAEQNLAAIARIRPPEEYRETHLMLYAQEKFNLLMLNIYIRSFASISPENFSTENMVIQLLQKLFQ